MDYNFNIALLSALFAFGFCTILGPISIPLLRRLKLGQNIRDDGPKSHLKKTGVPSMGGIFIIIAIFLSSFLFEITFEWKMVIFLMLSFSFVGFLDDYIKVVKRRSLGLRAYQKFLLQFIFATIFVFILMYNNFDTSIFIPFTEYYFDLGIFFPIFSIIVILGTANGANFTDGLDGLASSVTLLISLFFLYIAISFDSGLVSILAASVGSLLGFLLFNSYPARVFMGDTGSLALGALISSSAIILQMPLLIAIVAFVYLAEVLSVIIQVIYYKLTKKRFFKMAPIHHHFEMMGWAETKVVAIFCIITAILCIIGFLAISGAY